MKITKISILLFTVIVFVSCDCLQSVQGSVVDEATKQPISNVIVIKDNRDTIYTDSIGNFKIIGMTGGFFGCPKLSLSFVKEGYHKTTKRYPSCCKESSIVGLKKDNN